MTNRCGLVLVQQTSVEIQWFMGIEVIWKKKVLKQEVTEKSPMLDRKKEPPKPEKIMLPKWILRTQNYRDSGPAVTIGT